jgi:hypothetical protein
MFYNSAGDLNPHMLALAHGLETFFNDNFSNWQDHDELPY